MIQDIIVYSIIFIALGRTVYSIVLFFRKSKGKDIIVCSGCPQCRSEKIPVIKN